MRLRSIKWLAGLGGMFIVLASPAFGQNPSDAQNKLLAKRAAEADCYRKLAETVYGLQLSSSTYVKDFVTESDEIRTAVDAFVRGVRLGPPRYYEDGACEIEGEVTVAKVITTLKEVHAAHYHGNQVTTTDIEQIKERVHKDVIKAVGSGAPRPELPPDLPRGVEASLTALPSDYAPPTTMSVPGIWRTVSPQARLMAKEAARRDAQRKLLEQIQGLRLNSSTLVRDFVTESDEIATNAEGMVRGAAEVREYLHSDELIAEVTMSVPVERLVTQIRELHSQHYHGNRVTTTDISNIKKSIQRDTIEATGCGVPPARFIQESNTVGQQTPTWFSTEIKAVGEGTDPDITSAQGRLKAQQAARSDALRKLAEQVNGLVIQSQTTVRDFVTQNDDISAQVAAVVRGAVVSPAQFSDGVARVEARLSGAEVWSVVHDQMVITSRRAGNG